MILGIVPGPKNQIALWSINALTGELTATWTNTDGSGFPATIFFNNQFFDHSVGITGDLDAAVAAAKAQAPPDTCNIEFDKVPISPCAIAVKFFYTESREAGTCPPPWDGF